MSLTNPNTPVSQQDLKDFYDKIKPYLGIYPPMVANKFSKGDLYSTSEKMIGQWVNGKPLYQKAIEFNFSQSETTKIIDSTLTRSYIEDIVGFNGGYTQSDGNKMAIPRVPLSQFNGLTAYVDASGLIIARTSNTPIGSGFINVQYTKTTDSAISIGSDTDYSTTEKIVGTWVSGEPLYQRTVHLTNPSVNWTGIAIPDSTDMDICMLKGAYFKANYSGTLPWYSSDTNMGSVLMFRGASDASYYAYIKMTESTLGTVKDVWLTLQYTKTT